MSIRAAWVDDNRRSILRLDFEEQWTVEEMVDVLDGLRDLLDAAENPVSLVLHHGDDRMSGISKSTEVSLHLTPVFVHKNCKAVVVIGAQGRLRALYEVAASRQTDLHFAATLDEGYELIRWQ